MTPLHIYEYFLPLHPNGNQSEVTHHALKLFVITNMYPLLLQESQKVVSAKVETLLPINRGMSASKTEGDETTV